ncbi:MAG: SRPBCC family protein [Sciscionella sp.]
MSLNDYSFRHVWSLPAPRDLVFTVLAELGEYPQWWRQVREISKVDDECAELVCRSVLPYDLVFRARHDRRDEVAGVLRARLTGDLDGFCGWRMVDNGNGTTLVFDQHVHVTKSLLRALAPVARPILLANHAVMMREGRRGLLARLTAAARG